jgi:hypothetical protein
VISLVQVKSRVSTGPNGGPEFGAAVLFGGVDELAQAADPVLAIVAQVPDQAEPAAGFEDAGGFGDGPFGVDPVPGLGAEHGVGAVVGQGDGFGAAGQGGHVGQDAAEFGAHTVGGFHRDDVQAAVADLAGEFAGAGAEVHDLAGPGRQEPVKSFSRVRRAPALINGGSESEGGSGGLIAHSQGS